MYLFWRKHFEKHINPSLEISTLVSNYLLYILLTAYLISFTQEDNYFPLYFQ